MSARMTVAGLSAGLLLWAACSSFNSEDGAPAVDGGGGMPDASTEAHAETGPVDASLPRCNPSAPFADPLEQLTTTASQPAAWLTNDELVVLLSRNTADAGLDLYSARRPFVTTSFGDPEPIAGMNSATDDDNPTLTKDGLRLFFHSRRASGADGNWLHIFVATRDSPVSPFSPPVPVGGLPTVQANQLDPFIAPDGKTLYFVSHGEADAAAPDQDIWVTEVAADTSTSIKPPVALHSLNSPFYEANPILTADERVIYFTSNRDTLGYDIYRASRPSRTDVFSTPTRVAELSTQSLTETPTWVSPDDCEVWIAREAGMNGVRAIFRFRRRP